LLPSFSARNKERFGVGSVPVRAGVTLEARVDFTGARPGDVLADSRQGGVGMALRLDADGELEWFMSDGRFDCAAPADPGTAAAGGIRHVVAHVDAGPRLVWFTVDGRVSDGGDERQFGWRRFPAGLWNITGGPLRLAPRFGGRLLRLRVWDRALSVSEAVALHRAARSDA